MYLLRVVGWTAVFLASVRATLRCPLNDLLAAGGNSGEKTSLRYSARDSAFMLHTSPEDEPGFVDRCAVEAFTKSNPTMKLFILSKTWEWEVEYENVVIINRWDYETLFSAEPLVLTWFNQEKWKSANTYYHVADALKLVLLKFCGGLYLDTDQIIYKSLKKFPDNYVGFERKEVMNSTNEVVVKEHRLPKTHNRDS